MASELYRVPRVGRIVATFALAALCAVPSLHAQAFPQECSPGLTLNNGDKCQGPASIYKFGLLKFGFERADGEIFYFGSLTEFDAASISAGQTLASYLSGVSLPGGTYIAVRPVISISQTIAGGSYAVANVTCQQATTVQNRVDSSVAACTGPSDSQCVDGGAYWRVRDTSLGNMVISPTTQLTIKFDFDVSHGINYINNGGVCSAAIGDATDGPVGHLSPTLTRGQ